MPVVLVAGTCGCELCLVTSVLTCVSSRGNVRSPKEKFMHMELIPFPRWGSSSEPSMVHAMDVGASPGGRQAPLGPGQVAPDGSPGLPKCELQQLLLVSVTNVTSVP